MPKPWNDALGHLKAFVERQRQVDAEAEHDIMAAMASIHPRVQGAVLAVALLLLPAHARAAASVRLVYVRGPGAEECAGEDAVRQAVGARLGYDPFFAWARDTLFAEVTRHEGAFHVEIRLVDGDNMRRGARDISVHDERCSAVIDALGLTVSLIIDPSSVTRSGPAAPPDPAPSPPPIEPPVPPPAKLAGETPAIEVPRPEPATTHIGLGAVGSFGAAPAPSAGAMLFVGILWRALSLDLEARADLAAGAGLASVPGVDVSSSLIVGSIVPCVHLGAAFGCAVASAGAIDATSTARVNYEARQPWWAAGGRLGIELPLYRALSMRLYGELSAILTPYRLSVDTLTYDLSPVAGGVGLAMAWRIR